MLKITDNYVAIVAPKENNLACYSTERGVSIDTFFQSIITPFVPKGPNSDQLNAHFERLLKGESASCDLKEIRFYADKLEVIQSCHRGGINPRLYSNKTTYRNNNGSFSLGIDINTGHNVDETERYVVLFTPSLLNIVTIDDNTISIDTVAS